MNSTENLKEELEHWEQMGEEEKKYVDQKIEEEIKTMIEPTPLQLAELAQKKIRQYYRIDESVLFLKKKTIEASKRVTKTTPIPVSVIPHDFISHSNLTNETLFKNSSALYSEGYSLRAIGQKLRVPKSTLRDCLIRGGTELRPHSLKKRIEPIPKKNAIRNAPYGTFIFEGKLHKNSKEQMIIKRILGLKSAGLDLTQIAKFLNQESIRPRKAKEWNQATIGKIIKRINNP